MDPNLQQHLNQLLEGVLVCAENVRSVFGAGLLADCYLQSLAIELQEFGYEVDLRAEVPLIYKGIELDTKHPIDLVVYGQLMLTVLSANRIEKSDEILTHAGLRVSNLPMALILNFNAPSIRGDIRRIMNPNFRG